MLNNIALNPNEDKYRQINGTKPKIASTVMSVAGVSQLLKDIGFQEIETSVFAYLGEDCRPVGKYAHMLDDKLMPLRMQFMTPEEKEKTMLLMKRKAEFDA